MGDSRKTVRCGQCDYVASLNDPNPWGEHRADVVLFEHVAEAHPAELTGGAEELLDRYFPHEDYCCAKGCPGPGYCDGECGEACNCVRERARLMVAELEGGARGRHARDE